MIWLLLQLLRLRFWRSCGWLGVSWLLIWGLVVLLLGRKLMLFCLKWCFKVSNLALKYKEIRSLDLSYLQVIRCLSLSILVPVLCLFSEKHEGKKKSKASCWIVVCFYFMNWSLLKLLLGQYMLLMLFCCVTVVVFTSNSMLQSFP